MAYRRRPTRRTSRATGYSRGRNYSRSRVRAAPRRRSRRVSGGSRTIRLVVQTVAASPVTPQASVQPLRAMF